MIIGARIAERIAAVPTSQAALAREIGVSPQAVSKWVVGGTNETAKLYQIARFLRTTPEYLTGETDDPASQHLDTTARATAISANDGDDEDLDDDIVEIPEIDLAYGMGGTFLDFGAVHENVRKFPAKVIANLTQTPSSYLFIARGLGDSMTPTIHDNDYVFVDRSERTLRMGDQIWAIAYGEVGMIKRLRPLPDGTLNVMSDNPVISDFIAGDGEVNLIGRVIAALRKF